MTTPRNGPVPETFNDWMRNQEKRVMREERRPRISSASDLLGPGFGPTATHILDWNGEEARFNGFFHSEVDAANAPDEVGNFAWLGLVISSGNHAQQILWSHGGPEMVVMQRTMHIHANQMPTYTDWEVLGGGVTGSTTLAELLDVALTEPIDTGDVLAYDGTDWVNASINITLDDLDPEVIEVISTDGNPPSDEPVLEFIPGIGSLFFRWSEIVNDDPVTYRLHVNEHTPPITDGTMEVGSGQGLTAAAIRRLADGTAIDPSGNTTYYATVTVEDADGPNPTPSNTVSGVPALVTTADIAANAITADLLIANDAVIDALFGQTLTGTTIQTTETAEQGIKVGLVDGKVGLYAYDLNGNIFLKAIPDEGMAVVAGEVKSTTLTVFSGASFGGVTEVAKGGKIRLTAGTTPPTSPPTLSHSYAATAFGNDGLWSQREGIALNGTELLSARFDATASNAVIVDRWTYATGAFIGSQTISTAAFENVGGITVGSGYVWVLVLGDAGQWYVLKVNPATWAISATITMTYPPPENFHKPTLGWDAVNTRLLYARMGVAGTALDLLRYNPTTNDLETYSTILTTPPWHGDLAGIHYGATDLGAANRYIFTGTGSENFYSLNNARDTINTADEWQSGQSTKTGFLYDSTAGEWRSMNGTGSLRKYTSQDKSVAIGDASLIKWASNTLARDAAPTYETPQSPKASYVQPKRSRLVITTSAIANSDPLVAGEPDRVRMYVGSGVAEPARTAMWLAASPVADDITETISPLPTSGTNPPAANNFPDTGGSSIEAVGGGFTVDQSSNGSIGTGTFRDSVDARVTAVNALRARARASATTATSLASGTAFTSIPLDTMDLEYPASWSINGSGRLVVPTGAAGTYDCRASVEFAANVTGTRNIQIRVGAANQAGSRVSVPAVATASQITALSTGLLLTLADADQVHVVCWQNSGSALNTNVWLSLQRID